MQEDRPTIPPTQPAFDGEGFPLRSLVDGRYFIEEELGAGGMGLTYLATDRKVPNRRVVLKTLNAESLANADTCERFRAEGEALGLINDDGVVKLYDANYLHQPPFLVLEYVSGPSLRRVLQETGALPVARAVRLVEKIALALEAVHAQPQGIIHRDLKPDNILLLQPGQPRESVKLIDFGIAKVVDSAVRGDTTHIGLMGTPAYISPEQARGEKCDAQTDIYSLGVIACELLTGQPPFDSRYAGSLLADCRALSPRSRQALTPVMEKVLNDDPARRYETAADFNQAFQEACQIAGVRRKEPLAVALLLLAGLGGWFGWHTYAEMPPASPAPPSVTAPDNGKPAARRLRYALEAQPMNGAAPGGAPFKTIAANALRPGDKYQLLLESEQAGALYVLRESPVGWQFVFPRRAANGGKAGVPARSKVETGWAVLGTEQACWLVWASAPVPELETAFARADPEGVLPSAMTLAGILKENARPDPPDAGLTAAGDRLFYRLALRK